MKDNKRIQKTILISNKSVALIVYELNNKEKNILFASQFNCNKDEKIFKLSQLLTNAANFLGFNIKEANMIFDDAKMWKYEFSQQIYPNCFNKDDVAKQIFKKARNDNYYVNEIIFNNFTTDNENGFVSARVTALASNYQNYKEYLKVVNACNVKVLKSTNLYNCLNVLQNNKTLLINNNDIVICQYNNSNLIDIQTKNINIDLIYQTIKGSLNLESVNVDQVVELINNYSGNDYESLIVAKTFDLKSKTFRTIYANEIINIYKNEMLKQIDLDLKNTQIISESKINNMSNDNLVINNEIELFELSIQNAIAIENFKNVNETIDQFTFENRIDANLVARN